MSERNRRTNYINQGGIKGVTAWILMIIYIVKIIYMTYKNGMLGMTYYALADAVFVLVYILFGISVVPVLKKMLYFQVNHGSYRNAAKVYRTISGFMIISAAAVSCVLFFFSEAVSIAFFGTKLCSLLLKIMAGAILCHIAFFCLKGYVEGMGNPVPGSFAEILMAAVGLIVTMLFQSAFADYGNKVAALVRLDSYAYAYSVCCGAVGLLVGGTFGLIFLLLVKSFLGSEIKKRIHKDEMRKTDSVQDILFNFFGGCFTTIFVDNIGVMLSVILVVLYCHLPDKKLNGAGMIYTGIALFILPAGLAATQMSVSFSKHLQSIMKQADFYHAKERMAFYLKMMSYSILPYVTALFALAPLISETLLDTESKELTALIRIGAVMILCIIYSVFFRQTLTVLVKPYIRNLYAAILGVSGIVFFVIMSRTSMNAEECTAYAYLLACLLYLLVVCVAALKKIRIYDRIVTAVLIPFGSAVVSAVCVFGIYVLTDGKLMSWIAFVLCGILMFGIHNVIIVMLKIFEPHEWVEIPVSGFPVYIAKWMGKY